MQIVGAAESTAVYLSDFGNNMKPQDLLGYSSPPRPAAGPLPIRPIAPRAQTLAIIRYSRLVCDGHAVYCISITRTTYNTVGHSLSNPTLGLWHLRAAWSASVRILLHPFPFDLLPAMPSSSREPPVGTSNSSRDTTSPLDNNEMGLATYTHDRDDYLATRSFYFRDEGVRSLSFNREAPPERDQDRQSECTSFEGFDNQQTPGHAAHCFRATKVDRTSDVFNGDASRSQDPSTTREHHLHGGSVTNQSRMVNGDLDVEAFLAYFCAPRDEPPVGRRAGPRAAPRTGPRAGRDPRPTHNRDFDPPR
ncbi:hypothetical protein N7448_004431 [Penicillium atrosanguineum]|uniref:uncharacterized protein n=1 Tax=Penicillium atrosanguineum TaxID=1132637 RepID=UPI0023902AAE|nr:uncharacterized protein N7443_003397 [Penicillium atrosanguineum]KAJ5117917.1 hypothetical protein N7526_010940 [Penicillium atrosanguineum]KAJ5141023.1 hypothetical protein N7448_004431 [Penicillium atrosanguineum]KAJ5310936.1 hypothetical protein N7443_003397 [Penicillium atrosanguineum]